MRRAALLAMVAVIAACQYSVPFDRTSWHSLFPHLYYLPAVLAALFDGWRGGLVVAMLSGLALAGQPANLYLELPFLLGVALLIGLYTDRERR